MIDSGAAETVMPSDWLPRHEVQESEGFAKRSARGRKYSCAPLMKTTYAE